MPFITSKPYLLFIPYILYFLISRKIELKKLFLILSLCLISVGLSDGIASIVKTIFERPRPCQSLEEVNLLVGCTESFSFPSNHSANAFALAAALSYFFKGTGMLFYPIAGIIAFSRIYVGVHYPSDVILGALLGILVFYTISVFYNRAKENINDKSPSHEGRKFRTIFVLTTLMLTLLRFFYINTGPLDLSPDEAHCWEWSRRLDLSYYSKGPMIAYLIAFSTWLMGDKVFAIRFLAPVLLALSSVLTYKLAKDISDDEKTAATAGLLLQITPLFAAYGILMTIDSPFIFFWTLTLYLFWKAVNTQESAPPPYPPPRGGREGGGTPNSKLQTWLLFGITVGLGLLTKYSMAFFYTCAFLFFIFSKEHRFWLKRKEPYIAIILSLAVFSPVIIWNAMQGWVTLKHTAGQAHVSEGIKLSIKDFFEFLGSQTGIITPLLFFAVIYGALKAYKSRSLFTVHCSLFLFCFWAPMLGFFVLKSLQAKVQANWATPAYITAFIASSAYFLKRDAIKKGTKIFLSLALIMAFIVTVFSHYPEVLNLPVKTDPTSRIKGWKELGQETGKIYKSMAQARNVFVFSDSYQVSSELAFYMPGKPKTYCVNLGRRMNQYDIWGGFDNLIGSNAIFVIIGNGDFPQELIGAFDSYEKQKLTVERNGRVLRDYSIFKCYGFKGMPSRNIESY
ncbi:MAG: glycosyltransferase family 39 protein [Nitrospirae bacterium]|nr:glycosyltransferase family 39 protein [Nitrospirota bacterium]